MHLGGEAVGQVAGHGKPARRIEQVSNRLLNRGQLEPLDRAVLVAGNRALVLERPVRYLALGNGRGRGYADGPVRRPLAGEQLPGLIRNPGDLQRRMKAEVDHLGVLRRGKADHRLGRQVVRGRIQFGVDGVTGDGQRGPLRALGSERRDDRHPCRQH